MGAKVKTKVIWAAKAQRNLNANFLYKANDISPTYATRLIQDLVAATNKQLQTFPNGGRKVPEFETSALSFLKEFIYKGYRFIYNPTNAPVSITILTVIHSRQNLTEEMVKL